MGKLDSRARSPPRNLTASLKALSNTSCGRMSCLPARCCSPAPELSFPKVPPWRPAISSTSPSRTSASCATVLRSCTRLLTLVVLALAFGSGFIASAVDIITAVRCGRLVDPASGNVTANAVVVANGDRVIQAGPGAETSVAATARWIDLSNLTCLPGLIDVHDHLTTDASIQGYRGLGVSVPRQTVTGVRNA